MIRPSKIFFSIFAFIAVFCFVSIENADAQGILKEILERMDKHYRSLQTLQSDVDRSITNIQLRTSDPYEGKLVLLPGKGRLFAMRLDWSKPRVEILSIVNGRYLLFIPVTNIVYTGSSDSSKVKSGGGSALKALSMSEVELRTNFDPAYIGEEKLKDGTTTFHLKLTPKTRQNFKVADLWVDSDGMPRQATITASNGDTDTFFLSRIKKNESIDKSMFKVKVGNAKILEQ